MCELCAQRAAVSILYYLFADAPMCPSACLSYGRAVLALLRSGLLAGPHDRRVVLAGHSAGAISLYVIRGRIAFPGNVVIADRLRHIYLSGYSRLRMWPSRSGISR